MSTARGEWAKREKNIMCNNNNIINSIRNTSRPPRPGGWCLRGVRVSPDMIAGQSRGQSADAVGSSRRSRPSGPKCITTHQSPPLWQWSPTAACQQVGTGNWEVETANRDREPSNRHSRSVRQPERTCALHHGVGRRDSCVSGDEW